MHVIEKEDFIDRKFIGERTEGFESFRKSLKDFTPEVGEKITGVPKEKIIKAALLYGDAVRPGIYYTWVSPSILMERTTFAVSQI